MHWRYSPKVASGRNSRWLEGCITEIRRIRNVVINLKKYNRRKMIKNLADYPKLSQFLIRAFRFIIYRTLPPPVTWIKTFYKYPSEGTRRRGAIRPKFYVLLKGNVASTIPMT